MTTKESLCAALRTMTTETMTTAEVVEACLAAAPDAGIDDIRAALRTVADEQMREADRLELYGRCRRAGIRSVVDGRR